MVPERLPLRFLPISNGPEGKLTVYVHVGTVAPVRVQASAETMASSVLRLTGVRLEWRHRHLPHNYQGNPIAVELTDRPASDHPSDAIGFASTADGVHIQVFYDRIKESVSEGAVPTLMAYTLAHEIGHLLEGFGRHSESGIMKAHWTEADIRRMLAGSFDWAPEDVVLIRRGFADRIMSAHRAPN